MESLQGLAPRFRGLSCPYEPMDEGFLDLIANEHAVATLRLALDLHHRDLRDTTPELLKLFESALEHEALFGTAFDPALGELRTDLVSGARSGLIPTALFLGARGIKGRWSAALQQPRRLRWGEYPLPPATAIAVDSDGENALLEASLGGRRTRIALRQHDGRWTPDPETEVLPGVQIGDRRVTILPRELLDQNVPAHVLSEVVPVIEPGMISSFEQAASVIKAYVPEYTPWISRVLTYAFLLNPKSGFVESGSLENYLGFSHFSAYGNSAGFAELLIHEASHQYFNLLCLVHPFDDGTDTKSYYSTAVRRPRPLDRIGVAYHAFANVLFFYRRCLEAGFDDDGWCERHMARWIIDLRTLEEPLRENRALTVVGRSLCEPLMERLELDR